MADGVKISSLPSATTPSDNDVIAGVQNGTTKKFSFSLIKSWLQSLFVPTSRKVNNKALNNDISLDASDVGAVDTADVGVADGVASLDSTGKVPSSQLPPISSDASDITYDPTTSGLTATDVQAAIDEVVDDLDDKQPSITASGILKGDGAGGVSAATAGTDYQAPLTAGTDYATPAQLADKANQAQLAYVETGTTASRTYAVGEYFCLNGLLYRAKTAISSGASFTPGTNCVLTTVGAEIFGLFYRGWFPNGQSMLSVAPGIYRTSTNNLPAETVGVNPYGSLFISPLGYTFIMYINVDGAVSIWANNRQKWYRVTTTVIN